MGGGVSKQTLDARERKLAEREKLINEMEEELGLASEHPEDEEVLSLGWVAVLSAPSLPLHLSYAESDPLMASVPLMSSGI